jgi:hypothetical protein
MSFKMDEALVSTQSLTEMSTRNISGSKVRSACKVGNLTGIWSLLSRKWDSLDVSQTCRYHQPLTGIDLHFTSTDGLVTRPGVRHWADKFTNVNTKVTFYSVKFQIWGTTPLCMHKTTRSAKQLCICNSVSSFVRLHCTDAVGLPRKVHWILLPCKLLTWLVILYYRTRHSWAGTESANLKA